MAAKLLPHRRQHFLRKRVLLARAEAHKQGGREHVHGNGFVDGSFDGPAAFAGILHEARIFRKGRILYQCHGCEVEQPGTDHAAATPDFGYVSKVQIILLIFRKFRLVSVAEDVEALGIGLHDAVLDAVVHHLHKMSGAGWTAIDVAFFRGAGNLLATGSAWNVTAPGGKGLEDRIELVKGFFRAADHHAVAAVDTPDSTAGPDVHVVNAFVFEELRAADI